MTATSDDRDDLGTWTTPDGTRIHITAPKDTGAEYEIVGGTLVRVVSGIPTPETPEQFWALVEDGMVTPDHLADEGEVSG